MDEAVALRAELQTKGIAAYIVSVPPGVKISDDVINKISKAKLVVVLGTRTYDTGTCWYSTKEELEFVLEEKKYFFLIEMCADFEVNLAKFVVPGTSYEEWAPGQAIPMGLADKIKHKYLTL